MRLPANCFVYAPNCFLSNPPLEWGFTKPRRSPALEISDCGPRKGLGDILVEGPEWSEKFPLPPPPWETAPSSSFLWLGWTPSGQAGFLWQDPEGWWEGLDHFILSQFNLEPGWRGPHFTGFQWEVRFLKNQAINRGVKNGLFWLYSKSRCILHVFCENDTSFGKRWMGIYICFGAYLSADI